MALRAAALSEEISLTRPIFHLGDVTDQVVNQMSFSTEIAASCGGSECDEPKKMPKRLVKLFWHLQSACFLLRE